MARKFVELDEGDRIRAVGKSIDRTAPALNAIGALLVLQSQRSFRQQRKGGFRWRPRAVPNVAGIVSDLARGANPPSRRFTPRPALVDTGALRRSITFRVIGNTVEAGSNLSYASLQQEGGTSTLPVTDRVKKGVAKLIKQKPQLAEALGFLLSPKTTQLRVRVPARPFVLVTREDLAEINTVLEDFYGEAVTSGGT